MNIHIKYTDMRLIAEMYIHAKVRFGCGYIWSVKVTDGI